MNKYIFYTLAVIVFNTAIAGLLTIIDPRDGFWHSFIFSQCIGLSVCVINTLLWYQITPGFKRWAMLSLGLPGSVMAGLTLAFMLTGQGDWNDPRAWQSVVIGLFFGGIGSITFFLSERIGALNAEVKQRQLNEVESEKRQFEAHLKLLQAQIEPHFLFNTLANVSSLISVNPTQASLLLERLIDWLRVALLRTRSEQATLADELTLLENYLQIMAMRFGERLRWHIEATVEAQHTSFPPMLLQPLVENAVRHGIEPKLGGGELRITARVQDKILHLQVQDDGVGLNAILHSGTGLTNVRERLAALYGGAGRLRLESQASGGVSATLEIPL